jgi:hypothetical protein
LGQQVWGESDIISQATTLERIRDFLERKMGIKSPTSEIIRYTPQERIEERQQVM